MDRHTGILGVGNGMEIVFFPLQSNVWGEISTWWHKGAQGGTKRLSKEEYTKEREELKPVKY